MQSLTHWHKALISDGWTDSLIYPRSGKGKDTATHSAQYKRDGFVIQIFRSTDAAANSIGGYGPDPDNLAIELPGAYDWQAIQDAVHVCFYCKAVGETVRLGFAGRACPTCREKHKSRVEYPGWTR